MQQGHLVPDFAAWLGFWVLFVRKVLKALKMPEPPPPFPINVQYKSTWNSEKELAQVEGDTSEPQQTKQIKKSQAEVEDGDTMIEPTKHKKQKKSQQAGWKQRCH